MRRPQRQNVGDRSYPKGRKYERSPDKRGNRQAESASIVRTGCRPKFLSRESRASIARRGQAAAYVLHQPQASRMWPQREQRLLAHLATSPPNECPTIITDSTAGTSLYKPRIASTAWFRNSAWRTSWMAHNETEATQMGAQACKESYSSPHSRPRPRPQY